MRFLADEGVDQEIVLSLRKLGYLVDYIAESDKSLDDDAILKMARLRGAVVITNDKDFGDLIFRQSKLRSAVLLLRLDGVESNAKKLLVSSAITKHGNSMTSSFCVLCPRSLRIRPYRYDRDDS